MGLKEDFISISNLIQDVISQKPYVKDTIERILIAGSNDRDATNIFGGLSKNLGDEGASKFIQVIMYLSEKEVNFTTLAKESNTQEDVSHWLWQMSAIHGDRIFDLLKASQNPYDWSAVRVSMVTSEDPDDTSIRTQILRNDNSVLNIETTMYESLKLINTILRHYSTLRDTPPTKEEIGMLKKIAANIENFLSSHLRDESEIES